MNIGAATYQLSKVASLAEDEQGKQVIKLKFTYDLDTLNSVRSLPGRKFHSEQDCWSIPLYNKTIDTLIILGFTLEDNLRSFRSNAIVRENKIIENNGISGLRGTLRPFQSKGVAFIEEHHGRVLLADEMGLGKTVEALGWLQMHRKRVPVIIVTPASLKLNWKEEIEKWLPNPSVEVLSGQTSWIPTAEILIINYDILVYWWEVLSKLKPQVVITDECHKYKTDTARRTKAIKQLLKRSNPPYFLALSGTPIENRPVEIFNAAHFIAPTIFDDKWAYVHRFCGAKHTMYGWDFTGSTNKMELHDLLSTIMIRRLKKDVLPELPDKIASFVPMKLSNEKEYKDAEKDFISFVRQNKGDEAAVRASNAIGVTKIEGLKQLAVKGYLKDAINWIEDFIEVEEKLVVFATHKFVIEALMEHFGKIAVKVDGSVTAIAKQKAKNDFQDNKDIKLFVGNIEAAGEGITLTAASNVTFLELPWTPSKLKQAIDRLHRIGQLKSVNIWYLLAKGTIMEKIAILLDSKMLTIDSIIDGTVTEQDSMLTEIIKMYG